MRFQNLRKFEWLFAGTLTALLVAFHVIRIGQAGGLWRDEAAGVTVATLPTLAEVWTNLHFESFPMAWMLMLRGWTGLGLGTESGSRLLGCLVGLLIVGALWFNARQFKMSVPMLSLVLVGLNSAIIQWGDSMRAYGFAVFSILMAMGCIWRLVARPGIGNGVAASAAATLAAHSLYYNSLMVFVLSLAAVTVAMMRGQPRAALAVLGASAVAGLTVIPYGWIIHRVKAWDMLVKTSVDWDFLLRKHATALNSSGRFGSLLWMILLVLGLLAGGLYLRKRSTAEGCRGRGPATLFALVAAVLVCLGYYGFFRFLSYPTQPWYYLVWIGLMGVCLDVLFATWSHLLWLRRIRLIIVVAITAASLPTAWARLHTRNTNVDQVAARLEALADPSDLIIVSPWFVGISFRYHYQGGARVKSIPPIEDLRFHRFDLVKEMMTWQDPAEALDPLLDGIQRTLRSGNKVWVVGYLEMPAPGVALPPMQPAPSGPMGWDGDSYNQAWTWRVTGYLAGHSLSRQLIPVPSARLVSAYEYAPLTSFDGWRN